MCWTNFVLFLRVSVPPTLRQLTLCWRSLVLLIAMWPAEEISRKLIGNNNQLLALKYSLLGTWENYSNHIKLAHYCITFLGNELDRIDQPTHLNSTSK
jgi:hypothetical protein